MADHHGAATYNVLHQDPRPENAGYYIQPPFCNDINIYLLKDEAGGGDNTEDLEIDDDDEVFGVL